MEHWFIEVVEGPLFLLGLEDGELVRMCFKLSLMGVYGLLPCRSIANYWPLFQLGDRLLELELEES